MQDPKARKVLDWVDVVVYIAWAAISIALGALAVAKGAHIDLMSLFQQASGHKPH